MRVYFLIWGVVFSAFSIICPSHADNKCYQAKICVHDGKEKCGRDEEGNLRRFIDSCDIKEYNCLRGAEYKKVNYKECRDLPSIDEQVSKEKLKKVADEDKNQELEAEDVKTEANLVNADSQPAENEHDDNEKNLKDSNIDDGNKKLKKEIETSRSKEK